MTCHNLIRCVTQLDSVDMFFSMIFNRARFSLFSTWSITHLFLAMEFLPKRLPWASVLFAMIVCIAIRFQGKRWVFISVAILESPQTVLFSTTHSICVKKHHLPTLSVLAYKLRSSPSCSGTYHLPVFPFISRRPKTVILWCLLTISSCSSV